MSINSDECSIYAENVNVHYASNDYKINTFKEYLTKKLRGNFNRNMKHALKDFSAVIKPGECVGIIGHNGCGKSTLLKAIAEVISISSGDLKVNGSVVPLIELGAGFDPELTGRENIFLSCSLLGMTRNEIEQLAPRIIEFSELGEVIDTPVKTYSSGMYMRLGFACSSVMNAEIILIDEILAVGDLNFQRKCLDRLHQLKSSGSTIVIVSHDMSTLKTICERLIVIDQGVKVFDGSMSEGDLFYEELMEKKMLANMSDSDREEYLRKKKLQSGFDPDLLGKKVEILSASLEGGEVQVKSGDSFSLHIKIKVKTPLGKPPSIGFALHSNTSKVRILGLNSKLAKQVKRFDIVDQGIYSVKFNIDSLRLATGEYFVLAAVHNSDLTETLDIRECFNFKIVDECDEDNFDGDLLSSRGLVKDCYISPYGEI